MNNYYEPTSPFERRRTNRAILMVVVIAVAGIALNDAGHAFMTPAGQPSPRMARVVPAADQKDRAATIVARRHPRTAPAAAGSEQCLPYDLPRR